MAVTKLTMKIVKNGLVDLQNVIIDSTKPKQERVKSFLEQTNPYQFVVDEITVNVNFVGEETLEQKLKNLF